MLIYSKILKFEIFAPTSRDPKTLRSEEERKLFTFHLIPSANVYKLDSITPSKLVTNQIFSRAFFTKSNFNIINLVLNWREEGKHKNLIQSRRRHPLGETFV